MLPNTPVILTLFMLVLMRAWIIRKWVFDVPTRQIPRSSS